jgi:hypothetical protein
VTCLRRLVAEAFRIEAEAVVEVTWFGTKAVVLANRVAHEYRRRELANLGALPLDVVQAAAAMPLGITLPWIEADCELGADVLRGIADFDQSRIQRIAVPPVEVLLVITEGTTWRPVLSNATRFANVAPRAAIVSSRPADRDFATLQAAWFEAGLAVVGRDGSVDVLSRPGPCVGDDESFGWWFAEKIYEADLALDHAARGHPARVA